MKSDHQLYLSSRSQASKAADFILSFSRTEAPEPEEVVAEDSPVVVGRWTRRCRPTFF